MKTADRIDTQAIRERSDCRQVLERDLGQPKYAGSGGRAWAWRCPLHHEQHGYSLTAWREGWKCWGKCQVGGDAIKWLQIYHNKSFQAACEALGGVDQRAIEIRTRQAPVVSQPVVLPVQPPSAAWQAAALAAVQHSEQVLWSSVGEPVRAYLKWRGLLKVTIRKAWLGYNPSWLPTAWINPNRNRPAYLPPGIVIPWFADGQLWGVRVRCRVGNLASYLNITPDRDRDGKPLSKYLPLAGGQQAHGLYGADDLDQGRTAIWTEGEFDCLIVQQETDIICPFTTGPAGTPINPRWYAHVARCAPILICQDADEAGQRSGQRLAAFSQRARLIQVPDGCKDITEYHQKYPILGVTWWLQGQENHAPLYQELAERIR